MVFVEIDILSLLSSGNDVLFRNLNLIEFSSNTIAKYCQASNYSAVSADRVSAIGCGRKPSIKLECKMTSFVLAHFGTPG